MTRLPAAAALLLIPTLAAAQQYPTDPPEAAPLTPAAFPPIQEAVLPNGLRIMVVENRRQPVVSITLAFPAGDALDPAGKDGLASMTAGLLTKGAGNRTAEQIAETIEGAGGSLSASSGSDFLFVGSTVLTPHLDLAFDLLADVVMRPTFPAEELDLLRTQTLSALQVELTQPGSVAQRFFIQALYGEHPYGRSPTPASVQAITRDDVVAFHQARLRPEGALLVLTGDVNLAQGRAQVERALAGWRGAPTGGGTLAVQQADRERAITLVHMPGAVQSNILVGNLTTLPTDSALIAASLANRVLGGGGDSRLFLILREEKGWTYGAYSSLARRRQLGYFVASAEVRTEVTDSSLRELLHQLDRIRTSPMTRTEYEGALGAMVGSYPLSIETAEQVAGAVANARLYGLPDDYVQTYRVRLGRVTPPEALMAAARMIRPDEATVVVVGDGTRIYESLRGYGPVTIVDPTGKALTADDLVARTVALEFDPARLRERTDSFDILVQGNALGMMTASLARSADGWVYTESTRIGGFVEQDTEVQTGPDLSPRRVHQEGKVQGQDTMIDVTFAGGRATGSARTPTPEGIKDVTIDTAVAAGVLDDNLVQAVLPALPYAEGASWTFTVFTSGAGEFRQATLAVDRAESVTIGDQAHDAWVVTLTGGPQVVTFYMSREEQPRLLKLAIAGTPVEMVRR